MFQRGLQMRSDVFLNDMGLDDLDALGMICLQLVEGAVDALAGRLLGDP